MKKLLLILLFSFAHALFGQSLSIFDIDTTNFPTMKAKFWAFDSGGNQVRPSASELSLSENGINRKITNVSCTPPPPPVALSTVLVMDISGSMGSGQNGTANIDLAKTAATSWIYGLPTGNSECAITSFDNNNYLIQDFSKDKNKLTNSLNALSPSGGTDYDYALLNPLAGGLQISQKGKYKKVIIFLSDGLPNYEPQTTKIIEEAKKQNCVIYCVTLGMSAPQCMKDISLQTGGFYFENVTSISEAEETYLKILALTQGTEPCEINWESGINCLSENINVNINLNSFNGTSNYKSPNKSIAKLNVTPSYIAFGKISNPEIKDTSISLTAINSDFTIYNIKLKYGSSVFSIVNTSFPILISKNTSKNITIRCTPIDSSINFGSFEIETDLCPTYFSLNCGYNNVKMKTKTIKLIKPNGGEKFIAGSDTIITWEGISQNDTCKLELSIDNGANWKNLIPNASNLKYLWQRITKPESNNCLIKIKQKNKNVKDSTMSLSDHNFRVHSVAISQDGSKIVTGYWDYTSKIWDGNTCLELYKLYGHIGAISSVAITQDGSKIVTGSNDNTAKIWDANTGKEIRTLKGHTSFVTSVAISPDGSRIVTGSNDKTAKIWDANTGELIRTFYGHSNMVTSVAISQNGNKILTGSQDGNAKIWDTNTGDLIKTLIGHTGWIMGVAISQDGNIIVTGSWDLTAKIWDANLGVLIRTLSGHTSFITSVAISQDGSQIVTGSHDSTAKIWDAYSGELIRTLSGHSYIVSSVAISQDASKIVTGSEDKTAKIWDISDLIPLQEDKSDAVFSIVAPSPSSQDIDMKKCLVGGTKDSLISSFIMNKGNYPFRVDSIYFTGTDASAFSQVSGSPKFNVGSNSSKTAELRFQPKRIGLHQAKVNIITQTDTLVQDIIGEGVQPSIEIVNSWIDFGYVDIFSSKDTLKALTIKNTSLGDIDITNTYHLGPNDKDFTTLVGGGAFKLKAGETAKLDLRFAPKSVGRTSGRLMFEFNGSGSPAMVQLFGEGINNLKTKLQIDSFARRTGAFIDIPINLTLDSKVIKSGVKAFNFEIAYNKTLLYPLETYNTKVEDGYSIIRFDNMPITNDPIQVIKTLKFQTALGNAVETPLEIRTLEPVGNTEDIDVTLINGNLKLTDVCYDGGVRLLNGTKQTNVFAIYPNPANDNIEIEYSNADNGLAEFKLMNMMGEVVSSIQLEKTQNRKAKMNLKNLPSGQYFGVFNTESINQNMIISVIK